jgi:predicted protein tyrosine phosphatase
MHPTSTAACSNNRLDTPAAQALFRDADVPVKEDAVSVIMTIFTRNPKVINWQFKGRLKLAC